jgi:hypothetical protein
MSRKVVDCGAEWAACRCFDQILLELGTELATDALDQPFPTLAERCRFRRCILESAATGERAELALCGRDRLTCGGELVELSQELPDSVCDVACGGVTLADADRELSMGVVHPLEACERLALLDETLFELVDRALGDRDAPRRLGLTPFQVCDSFATLT